MLTNFENLFDLEEETKAIILSKKNNPKSGDQLKVYIPRIMRGIEKGKPKIKISPIQYRGAFANASECKPKISTTLREQNYLLGLYQNNSASKSVVKVVYNEEEDIEKTYIPDDKEVRCLFVNGKLKQLRLNTNNNMEYSANEYVFDQYVLKADSGEDEEDEDDVIEEVNYTDDTEEEEVDTSKLMTKNGVTVTRKSVFGTKIR